MEFTSLNVGLIAFGSLLIGIFGHMVTASKAAEQRLEKQKAAINEELKLYVKKTDCESQHKYDLATVEQIARLVSKIERNTRIQFKMLRAIVAYMDLTAQQKAEILNTESGEREGDGY